MLVGGIGAGNIAQVLGKSLLHPPGFALAGLGCRASGTVYEAGSERTAEHIDGSKGVNERLVIIGAHHRPMAFDPERRRERWHHGKTCLILAEQGMVQKGQISGNTGIGLRWPRPGCEA
jgi:hypothetical protein